MKTITVKGITGSWNEKVYKNNTIYLNGSPVALTENELDAITGKSNESDAVKISRQINEAAEQLRNISIAGFKKMNGTEQEIENIYNALTLLHLEVKNMKNKFFYDDYKAEGRAK